MEEPQSKRKPTGRHPGLRSFDSRLFNCQVSLRFYNMTHRKVDILWVDYQQNYVLYKTLNRSEHYDIRTYVGHPWVFEDSLTRDPMVVHGQEVYWPIQVPSSHLIILGIKYPLLSLRTLASRAVRDQLNCVACAMKLDLPLEIRDDMVMLMKTMYYHKNRATLNWEEEPVTQKPSGVIGHKLVLIALILHDVLFDVKEMNVSPLALMSIQVFLQWVQKKIDPNHPSVQALVKVFETFLEDEETWLEVDPIFIEHASEFVHKLILLLDVHSSVKSVEDVLKFVERNATALMKKYGSDSGEV